MTRRPLLPLAVFLAAAMLLPLGQAQAANSLVAPSSTCADQNDLDAPTGAQLEAMRCMVDFARRQSGLRTFGPSRVLDWSAAAKSDDVLRCNSFSHSACGRDAFHWIRASGYLSARCWRTGENLAWGTGQAGTVRSIFVALLNSPHHRENILGSFAEIGVGFRVGRLGSRRNVHVWTQHFGSRCAAARSRSRGGKI